MANLSFLNALIKSSIDCPSMCNWPVNVQCPQCLPHCMLYEIGFGIIKWGVVIKKHVFSLSNKCFWILESFESFCPSILSSRPQFICRSGTNELCEYRFLDEFHHFPRWCGSSLVAPVMIARLAYPIQTIAIGYDTAAVFILPIYIQIVWMWRTQDDVITRKHFPSYWPFVRGIHRSPANSTHKGPWCGALMFSLICAWTNGWVNNPGAGDLRSHGAHYDVIVMLNESSRVYDAVFFKM